MPPRKKTPPAVVTCQECKMGAPIYIPCGNPAVQMIGWKGRQEPPIPMCEMCADHNLRNRNGVVANVPLATVPMSEPSQKELLAAVANMNLDAAAPGVGHNNPPPDRPTESDEALIAENFKIEELIKAATAKLNEWAKPHKDRLKVIEDELFRRLAERQADSTRTDAGTAYISNITNFKIEQREAILDFMLDNWDQPDWGGGTMMSFNVTKDAVKQYMDKHDGQLPPGLSISHFSRLNIRRS